LRKKKRSEQEMIGHVKIAVIHAMGVLGKTPREILARVAEQMLHDEIEAEVMEEEQDIAAALLNQVVAEHYKGSRDEGVT